MRYRTVAASVAAALLLSACAKDDAPYPQSCGVRGVKGQLRAADLVGDWRGDKFGRLVLSDPPGGVHDQRDGRSISWGDHPGPDMGKLRFWWRKDLHGKASHAFGPIHGTGKWWVTRTAGGLDTVTMMFKYKPGAATTYYLPLFLEGTSSRPRLSIGFGYRWAEDCTMNTLRRTGAGRAGG